MQFLALEGQIFFLPNSPFFSHVTRSERALYHRIRAEPSRQINVLKCLRLDYQMKSNFTSFVTSDIDSALATSYAFEKANCWHFWGTGHALR